MTVLFLGRNSLAAGLREVVWAGTGGAAFFSSSLGICTSCGSMVCGSGLDAWDALDSLRFLETKGVAFLLRFPFCTVAELISGLQDWVLPGSRFL